MHEADSVVGHFDGPYHAEKILNPAYLRSGLSVLIAKASVEWKPDFQNELTNQKSNSKSELNVVQKQHHNKKPCTFFHFQ